MKAAFPVGWLQWWLAEERCSDPLLKQRLAERANANCHLAELLAWNQSDRLQLQNHGHRGLARMLGLMSVKVSAKHEKYSFGPSTLLGRRDMTPAGPLVHGSHIKSLEITT